MQGQMGIPMPVMICFVMLPCPTCLSVYDPAEFQHLQVSSELKELFQHITRYTPQTIELETKLKPFIPEYIPAIGDIDAFLKVYAPLHPLVQIKYNLWW